MDLTVQLVTRDRRDLPVVLEFMDLTDTRDPEDPLAPLALLETHLRDQHSSIEAEMRVSI